MKQLNYVMKTTIKELHLYTDRIAFSKELKEGIKEMFEIATPNEYLYANIAFDDFKTIILYGEVAFHG